MNTTRSLDFPIWVPSALVKELRQGLRTSAFIIMTSMFPALMALFFLFSFITNPADEKPYVSPTGCNAIFWMGLSIILLLVMPIRALSSVREELVSRNSELLLLTRQSAGRIILGKWISFMAQSLIIAFISLPFCLIRYYYGQIDLMQDLTMFIFIYLGSGVLVAFSLWASALPSLLRVIIGGILGFAVVGTGIDHFNMNFFQGGLWENLLLAFIILADISLVITTLLMLASEWFSPAAHNTAAPLRKLLLAFFAASTIPLFFLKGASLDVQTTMNNHLVFLMIYSIFLMVVNLTDPAGLLPVHVEQMKGKPFSTLRQFLFLPGLPSGVFFTLLLCVLAAVAAYINPSSPHQFTSLQFLFCFASGFWYAIVMPAMLLKPFWKKLRGNTILVYILIWLLISLLLQVLETVGFRVPLIPGGYLHELFEARKLAPFSEFTTFSLINLAAGFTMLFLVNRRWFAIRRESAASPPSPEPEMKATERE